MVYFFVIIFIVMLISALISVIFHTDVEITFYWVLIIATTIFFGFIFYGMKLNNKKGKSKYKYDNGLNIDFNNNYDDKEHIITIDDFNDENDDNNKIEKQTDNLLNTSIDKEKINKEFSKILKDLEEKNNIKYFYNSDIIETKKHLQEKGYDMDNLEIIEIYEKLVNQFNLENKDNKISKEKSNIKVKKDSDKNMVEMKNNVKIAKELKNRVERIESFEEQLGVTLENISFHIDNNYFYLNINGEIIKNSDECNIKGLYVCAVIYNNDDEILYTGNTWIANFMGYDTFNIEFNTNEYDVNSIKRIRIFVKE